MGDERLELDQDKQFQRREWRVQRIAWVIWAALICAALLGLVGSGPLSSQTVSTPDGRLSISYDRFVHLHHPTTLEITMRPENENEDSLRLRLSQSFLDAVRIERIEPEPTSHKLSAEGAWYEFRCERGAASASVTFHLEHDQIGSGVGLVHLAGSQIAKVVYFVYP